MNNMNQHDKQEHNTTPSAKDQADRARGQIANRQVARRGARGLSWAFVLLNVVLIGWAFTLSHFAGIDWPTGRLFRLTSVHEVTTVLGLVLCCGTLWMATRTTAQSHPQKVWLKVAFFCSLVAVGGRILPLFVLYSTGMLHAFEKQNIYDKADIYYVQAVTQQLEELRDAFEIQLQANHGVLNDEQSEELQARWEVVERLHHDMATWTETEIGHWLNGQLQQQRLITLLAYQINPRPGQFAVAQETATTELIRLEQRRACFTILEEYCSRKVAIFDQLRTDTSDSAPPDELPSLREKEEQLLAEFQGRLETEGLCEEQTISPIMKLTRDSVTAAECALGIKTHLADLDQRLRFLREELLPRFEQADIVGWNQQYPWLKLPIVIPSGRKWLGAYVAATAAHSLLMLMGILFIVMVIRASSSETRSAELHVFRFWFLTLLIWCLFLPIFF
jgi:hypothetical protein